MILFKTSIKLQQYLEKKRNSKATIGFVPTMGALHNGHLALIEQCKNEADITVCSIFVNPTQFNDPKDFEKYPVTIEQDILLLEKAGTNILFLPSVQQMYPTGTGNLKTFDIGNLENILEGYYRPAHFQGVCNVVYTLLQIVQPAFVLMGQKDYQQYLIIKKMAANFFPSTQIKMAGIIREESGLAMSSRNARLSETAKQKATILQKALQFIQHNISNKNIDALKQTATQMILQNGFSKVDYIEICDANNLTPILSFNPEIKTIALVAAFIEEVRLIDNLFIN